MMMTGSYFAILLCVTLGCQAIHAETTGIPPMTDAQRQGALFLDTLSVPSPGEVFAALNTSAHPNWATLVSSDVVPMTTDRTQLALMVGVLAANGYIAVEAQDGPQVKNIGHEIMMLAKALGVSKNLMGRGNSLLDFADNNAWDSLAEELEATENEVKRAMVDQKDYNLVTLISAASWLHGLDVASGVTLQSPQLHGVSSIDQPEFARHLSAQLDSLPDRVKKGALFIKVKSTLDEVAELLERMKSPSVNKQSVIEGIHAKTTTLLKAIFSSSGVKSSTPQPSPAKAATGLDSPHSKP